MSQAKSESLGGSTSSGYASEQASTRVTIKVVGGYIAQLDFDTNKRVIDNITIPPKVKTAILRDQGLDPRASKDLHARHIIPKRAVINYWEHHLKDMTLEQAEKAISDRAEFLIAERSTLIPKGKMSLKEIEKGASIDERAENLAKNVDKLITLELTSHHNIFYGPAIDNSAQGGRISGSVLAVEKSTPSDYTVISKNSLDLGDDEPTKKYLTAKVQAKIAAAVERDKELGITKLYFEFIHGTEKRKNLYPERPEWPANLEGQSRPNSPHHIDNPPKYESAQKDAEISKKFASHMEAIARIPPVDLDSRGNHIIHHAVVNGDSLQLQILLLQCRDLGLINSPNALGQTPLDIAQEKKSKSISSEVSQKYEEIIKCLEMYGAKSGISLGITTPRGNPEDTRLDERDTHVQFEKTDDLLSSAGVSRPLGSATLGPTSGPLPSPSTTFSPFTRGALDVSPQPSAPFYALNSVNKGSPNISSNPLISPVAAFPPVTRMVPNISPSSLPQPFIAKPAAQKWGAMSRSKAPSMRPSPSHSVDSDMKLPNKDEKTGGIKRILDTIPVAKDKEDDSSDEQRSYSDSEVEEKKGKKLRKDDEDQGGSAPSRGFSNH